MPTRTLVLEGRWIGGEGPTLIGKRELVPVRTLGPEREWIVRSHIGWGGERNNVYKGVETSLAF